MSARRFVKSSDTSTSAANSRAALEKILLRYGCKGFGSHTDYDTMKIAVSFRVADKPAKDAPQVPVRLVVSILEVATAMWGPLRQGQRWADRSLEQAERVAWRHLVLWVDAACSAATAGMQPMSEAFFAHLLVRDAEGRLGRMVDYARTLGSDTAMMKALTAGTPEA